MWGQLVPRLDSQDLHWRAAVQNNGYVVVMSNMTRVKGGSRNGGGGAFDGQQARLNPMSPAIGRSPAYGPSGTGNLASPRHDSCAPLASWTCGQALSSGGCWLHCVPVSVPIVLRAVRRCHSSIGWTGPDRVS